MIYSTEDGGAFLVSRSKYKTGQRLNSVVGATGRRGDGATGPHIAFAIKTDERGTLLQYEYKVNSIIAATDRRWLTQMPQSCNRARPSQFAASKTNSPFLTQRHRAIRINSPFTTRGIHTVFQKSLHPRREMLLRVI